MDDAEVRAVSAPATLPAVLPLDVLFESSAMVALCKCEKIGFLFGNDNMNMGRDRPDPRRDKLWSVFAAECPLLSTMSVSL